MILLAFRSALYLVRENRVRVTEFSTDDTERLERITWSFLSSLLFTTLTPLETTFLWVSPGAVDPSDAVTKVLQSDMDEPRVW